MFKKLKIEDIDVLQEIEELENLKDTHVEILKYILDTTRELFALDFLSASVLNRSLNIIIPFCDLIREKNIIVAASLIRLQLDNVIRFYAAFIVEHPHKFALEVMEGKQIRKIRDRDGKLMKDFYLYTKLSEEENMPWIKEVYKNTSGFIHLSNKHIYNTISLKNKEDRIMSIKLSYGEPNVEDSSFMESISAFKAITELLFKYLNGWGYTKIIRREPRNDNE